MLPISLIVGLGNFGSPYIGTRHNIGEMLLQSIAKNFGSSMCIEKKFIGFVGYFFHQQHKITLLYPKTYINNSGLAVSKITKFYKFEPRKILVIHDDIDLKCGDIRLKKFGGHGGHNGLRDIINRLGTKNFYRLRIGIGHPGSHSQVFNYVLSKPSTIDKFKIDDAISRSILYIKDIIEGNHQYVMNRLHSRV